MTLEQQIVLLTLKKEHLENLIVLARGIKAMGVNKMDFTAFDTRKIDEYAAQAKAMWGKTPEYLEFEEKNIIAFISFNGNSSSRNNKIC